MAVLGTLGLAGGGGLYTRNIEPHWLEILKLQVPLPDLPSALEGLTIAQLSDLHVGRHGGLKNLRRAVDTINEQEPDLVVVTGDYVLGGAGYADRCGAILAELEAPHGVYGVLGNHDVWEGSDEIAAGLARHGLCLLRDQRTGITYRGERLWLLGVEDRGYTGMSSMIKLTGDVQMPGPDILAKKDMRTSSHQTRFFTRWAGAREALKRLITDLAPDEPRLLLVHNPDFAEMVDDIELDLLLAGHTHGGQVRLPLLGAPLLPSCFGQKYAEGLVRARDLWVYVNRGLGLVTPAVRFNCRPEITLLKLRRDNCQTG
jgi:hypothetical protein